MEYYIDSHCDDIKKHFKLACLKIVELENRLDNVNLLRNLPKVAKTRISPYKVNVTAKDRKISHAGIEFRLNVDTKDFLKFFTYHNQKEDIRVGGTKFKLMGKREVMTRTFEDEIIMTRTFAEHDKIQVGLGLGYEKFQTLVELERLRGIYIALWIDVEFGSEVFNNAMRA